MIDITVSTNLISQSPTNPAALTSDSHFVKLPELLVRSLSGHIVSQTDGAEGNETEVEGLQEVPVILQSREDGSRNEEEAGHGQRGEQSGVNNAYQGFR